MTAATRYRTYNTETPVSEPIEIRISYRNSNRQEVLSAWYKPETGVIGYSLTSATSDTPLSLSNLQAKRTYPRKAVPGWQSEVAAYAASGLGGVSEIR